MAGAMSTAGLAPAHLAGVALRARCPWSRPARPTAPRTGYARHSAANAPMDGVVSTARSVRAPRAAQAMVAAGLMVRASATRVGQAWRVSAAGARMLATLTARASPAARARASQAFEASIALSTTALATAARGRVAACASMVAAAASTDSLVERVSVQPARRGALATASARKERAVAYQAFQGWLARLAVLMDAAGAVAAWLTECASVAQAGEALTARCPHCTLPRNGGPTTKATLAQAWWRSD